MEFSRNLLKAAQWACLIVCLAALALAQSERGTITGAVRDASGASIPGCQSHRHRNQATNVVHPPLPPTDPLRIGEFTVPSVLPSAGVYIVPRCERADSVPPLSPGLIGQRRANRPRRCASLEVGTSVRQAVEVQATAVLSSSCRRKIRNRARHPSSEQAR